MKKFICILAILFFIFLGCDSNSTSVVDKGPTGIPMVTLNMENTCTFPLSYGIGTGLQEMYSGFIDVGIFESVTMPEGNYIFCFEIMGKDDCHEVVVNENINVGYIAPCVRYGINLDGE